MQASIVIRTLNEARYLGALLQMIAAQKTAGLTHEVVVVDSGSTDGTLAIAEAQGARIVTIDRAEFSFGRSLNRGCRAATGEILVMISGHCVPKDDTWLQQLCQPLIDGVADYSYGGQGGGPDSQFSETRIFARYFPQTSAIPQAGFFCNNANAAVTRAAWQAQGGFDEDLTGLEDMALAKAITAGGGKVAYVAPAAVTHHHDETWAQVRRRFQREAIALRQIMPDVQITRRDTARYIASAIAMDLRAARKVSPRPPLGDIIRYRIAQYTGSYKGHHDHRRLSRARKDAFYYPSIPKGPADDHSALAHESKLAAGEG